MALIFPIVQFLFYLISGVLFRTWFGKFELVREEKSWIIFLNEISVGITMLLIVSDSTEERCISILIISAYIFGNHFPYDYCLNDTINIKKDILIWKKNYLKKVGKKWTTISGIISILCVLLIWLLSTYREVINSVEIGIGIGSFISAIGSSLYYSKKRKGK